MAGAHPHIVSVMRRHPQAPFLSNHAVIPGLMAKAALAAKGGKQIRAHGIILAARSAESRVPKARRMNMPYSYKIVGSPVGRLKLVASDKGLAAILWENDDPGRVRLGAMVEATDHPVLLQAERQLAEYFAGTLKAFTVPLD